MSVSSDQYSSLTTTNRSVLKRFSHSSRFSIAVDHLNLKPSDSVLDFGTGNGELLFLLEDKFERFESLIGYEPMQEMFQQLQDRVSSKPKSSIKIVNEIPKDTKFNKVSCFEVLEHLTTKIQTKVLNDCRQLLTDDGLLVISVPIEIGFSGLMKNIARIMLRQTHDETTIINVIKSAFSIEIERPNNAYIPSHIGFNHKRLENIFPDVGLKILTKTFSPLPVLRGALNSQVFYVLRKFSQ